MNADELKFTFLAWAGPQMARKFRRKIVQIKRSCSVVTMLLQCCYNVVTIRIVSDFEWDDEKEEHNLKKHGVSFAEATTVFGDPQYILF